jgi:hypothetical protein
VIGGGGGGGGGGKGRILFELISFLIPFSRDFDRDNNNI